jgi:hypothetical protein
MSTVKNLQEAFSESGPATISLATLATSLNVLVARLLPLVGTHLQQASPSAVTSATLVHTPSPAALIWMRQWFMPAHEKLLFSREDLAGLLDVPAKEVLRLAAEHAIPTVYDDGFGWMFSAWAARTLLVKSLAGRAEMQTQRFDKIALLWFLLEKDPNSMPRFTERFEEELGRISELEEPARSLRSLELWKNITQSIIVANCIKASTGCEVDSQIEGALSKFVSQSVKS